MQVRTITIVALLVCLSVTLFGAGELSLRLNPSFFDESNQTLYVDVEIRYDGHGLFRLADQNYRLFYDSQLLSLKKNHSRSDLPQDIYSDIQFMEVLEELNADAINQLNFDDNMGFVNFFIDLNSPSNAGLSIRQEDEWQRIAVLNFKVSNAEELSELVWSKSGSTDSYATAFVEIMEWVAPNETVPAGVGEYIDAKFQIDQTFGVDISVSPNPTTDFITVRFDQALQNDLSVVVYDLNGKLVKETQAYQSSEQLNLGVTELMAGTYTIELHDAENDRIVETSTFIKIDQ